MRNPVWPLWTLGRELFLGEKWTAGKTEVWRERYEIVLSF
jgi:hypothetical protein